VRCTPATLLLLTSSPIPERWTFTVCRLSLGTLRCWFSPIANAFWTLQNNPLATKDHLATKDYLAGGKREGCSPAVFEVDHSRHAHQLLLLAYTSRMLHQKSSSFQGWHPRGLEMCQFMMRTWSCMYILIFHGGPSSHGVLANY
jgi:hypothetical protein